ncbi:MAG: DUF5119 domain-containing protein [Alistipes sp.]|nr:DUF5119 domain-containing protein [Alistipes sp.]
MKRTLYIALSALWLLIGCNHKDLCMSHPHLIDINVQFDWSAAPDAMPHGMCVYFYPTDGSSSWQRFDFDSRLGGKAQLHVGKYHAIFYNNDTTGVLFADTDTYDRHYLYTREGDILEPIYGNAGRHNTPRARGAEDESVVICPDMMWGGYTIDINVTDDGISYSYKASRNDQLVSIESPEKVLTLHPVHQTSYYTYEILNVENLKYASLMCASLTGMAAGVTMADHQLSDVKVTIPFVANADLANNRIYGDFITFGHHPANNKPHKLVLYVVFDNGEKYYYTFDVTDQVDNSPDPLRIHLKLDKLTFPTPIYNGGGFDVDVDDWVDVNVDIVL